MEGDCFTHMHALVGHIEKVEDRPSRHQEVVRCVANGREEGKPERIQRSQSTQILFYMQVHTQIEVNGLAGYQDGYSSSSKGTAWHP